VASGRAVRQRSNAAEDTAIVRRDQYQFGPSEFVRSAVLRLRRTGAGILSRVQVAGGNNASRDSNAA
jgi:hypothetical protein